MVNKWKTWLVRNRNGYTQFVNSDEKKGVSITFKKIRTFFAPSSSEKKFGIRNWWRINVSKGTTPLHVEIENKRVKAAESLLDSGADIHTRDKDGKMPIHIAAGNGDVDMVRMLVRRGSRVNCAVGLEKTPLLYAVANDHAEVVKVLMESGADSSVRDTESLTALHIAAKLGCAQAVKALVDKGMDIEIKSSCGSTPLHIAAANNRVEVLKLLMSEGAELHPRDKGEDMPIHCAARVGHKEAVKALLDGGAYINAPTKDFKRPLHLAVANKHDELVQLLLREGVDVNATCSSLGSPLFLASLESASNFEIEGEMIKVLLDGGSDVNILYLNHATPVSISQTGTTATCNVFKKHLVKMQTADLLMRKGNWRFLDKLDNKFISFRQECTEELERMKSVRVTDSATLFDLLTEEDMDFSEMCTRDISQIMESLDYEGKFPHYVGLIKCRLTKGLEEMQLLELGREFFIREHLPLLPIECIDKILSYLNFEDFILLRITEPVRSERRKTCLGFFHGNFTGPCHPPTPQNFAKYIMDALDIKSYF